MQKKNETTRLYNLTNYTNGYKALIQLLTEFCQKTDANLTSQDVIRWALHKIAAMYGITQADIDKRAAELDAADQMKAGQQ